MTDTDSAHHFNEAVSSTAVIGEMRADVRSLKEDVTEIKSDVKAIHIDSRAMRHTMDRYAGAMVVVGTVVSVSVTVAIAFIRPFLDAAK